MTTLCDDCDEFPFTFVSSNDVVDSSANCPHSHPRRKFERKDSQTRKFEM